MEDVQDFHNMLVKTTKKVAKELKKGRDVETLNKKRVLKKWASFGETGYMTTGDWINTIAKHYHASGFRKAIIEPVYITLNEEGVDAAIALFKDYKTNRFNEYRFISTRLAVIGRTLIE
ncbi:MAG: hypothetical protein V3W14_04655 [Candidatus Neomarinimicrobiota bacterium]